MFSKTKNIIPSVITFTSLILSLLIIVFAKEDNLNSYLLLFLPLAVLCDFLDGFVARRLNAVSKIGFELDSLIDAVSFGVAPFVVLIRFYGASTLNIFIFILLSIAGIYRLARFNVNPTSNSKDAYYEGLPIPFTAIVIPLLIFLETDVFISYFVVIVISFLMISKLRIPKFVK